MTETCHLPAESAGPDDDDAVTKELWAALGHLRDGNYQPGESLCTVLDCRAGTSAVQWQSALLHAIIGLLPPPETPCEARASLLAKILNLRYVTGCTQEQTAEALGISVRQVNRLQHEAAHRLAVKLWERHQFGEQPETRSVDPGTSAGTESWQAQMMQEVLSLSKHGNVVTDDLALAIGDALAIVRALDGSFECPVQQEPPITPIAVRIHPSALRQVILAVVRELLRVVPHAEIFCEVEVAGEQAIVRFIAEGFLLPHNPAFDSARELLLLSCGGSISQAHDTTGFSVVICLPICQARPKQITVLAIDDNADLVALFSAYCEGTPYHVIQARAGREALDAVKDHQPDLILLDVMLPDMDGWDLLRKLHASPFCAGTPVIVCSVMADKKLALALGATTCLRKPVWRQQLLDAFQHALSPAPGKA